MSESKTTGAKSDEVLLGVPVKELPELPWSYSALGREKYYALAHYGGYFNGSEQATFTPDLDPRSFARGVAWRLISSAARIDARLKLNERTQIVTDILEQRITGAALNQYFPEEFVPQVSAIVADAKKLADAVNAKFGELTPTARNAEAVKFAEALRKAR